MTISRRQLLTGSALATFGLLLSHPTYAAAGLNARLAHPLPQPADLRSVAALDVLAADASPDLYRPALPFRLVDTHSLSDDYFVTDLVTVNLGTTGAAAADEVQAITRRDGSVEALVLSQQDNRVYHLRRDPTSPSGWSYVPLCGGDAATQITQIAAGYDAAIDLVQVWFREANATDNWLSAGYFGDDNVWHLASGAGWYSWDVPGHPKVGRDDQGALFCYVWGSPSFYVMPVLSRAGDQVSASYTTVPLTGYVPTPAVNWIARHDGQDYAWCTDGNNFCTVTPDHVGSYLQGNTAQQLWAGVVQPAPLDDGTVFDTQLAIVTDSTSDPGSSWSGATITIDDQPSKLLQDPSEPDSNAVVVGASQCVIGSGSTACQAYIVGVDNTLYTQIPGYDGQQSTWPDPTPLTPLFTDVVAVYAPPELTDDLTLFTVGTDETLTILSRSPGSASTYTDPTTGQPVSPVNPANGPWAATQVHRASEEMFRTTCWRTELTVLDASGVPAPGLSVQISPDVDVALWQQSGNTLLTAGRPALFTTGPDGKITLAAPAFALHTATYTVQSVVVNDDGTWTPDQSVAAIVAPDGAVHAFLAGTTPSATTVADSITNATNAAGAPLFPGLAAPGAPTADAVAGFLATAITAGQNPTSAPTSPLAWVSSAAGDTLTTASLSGWWGRAKKDAESAFRAAESGIVDAANHVCAWSDDLGHWVAGLDLGGWIQDTMNWVITGVKSAMHAVTSLLRSLGAELDDLLHWLKDELLDFFADVGRATTQLYTWITVDMNNAVTAGISELRSTINASFFTALGAGYKASMHTAATDVAISDASLGSLRDNPPPTATPAVVATDTSAVAGQLRGLIHDARANWLMDKVKSHQMVDPAVNTDLGNAMTALADAFDEVGSDLKTAFTDVKALIEAVLSGQTSEQSLDQLSPAALVDKIADELVEAATAALDGILTAVCDLADAGWTALMDLLSAPLDSTFGFLSPVLDLLGIGELSLGQLMCGLVAVPGTVAGRIVFDGGSMFGPSTTGLTGTDAEFTNLIGLGTVVVEVVDIIINAIGDLAASAAFPDSVTTPTVVFAAGVVFSIIGNGFGYPFSGAPGVDWTTPQQDKNGGQSPLFAWVLGFLPAVFSAARQFGGGSADDISRGQSWLTTLFGIISLGFAIDASVDTGASPAGKAIAVLSGLNTACTALDQFAEESAGVTLIAKLLLDVLCPLGVVGAEVSVLMAAQNG